MKYYFSFDFLKHSEMCRYSQLTVYTAHLKTGSGDTCSVGDRLQTPHLSYETFKSISDIVAYVL